MQVLIWAGAIVGMLFVSPAATEAYGQVARVGAGFFIVFQVIELINFVYYVNEWLLEKDVGWTWVCLVGGELCTALLAALSGRRIVGSCGTAWPAAGCTGRRCVCPLASAPRAITCLHCAAQGLEP